MAARKSAFSVFRGKERSKKELDVYVAGTSSPTLKPRQGSLPDVSNIDASEKVLSLTPPTVERMAKRINKSEPRFNSFRKSLRKRSKKDPHHEVNLKQNGKENKIQKVFEQSDWGEKLQTLDSLSLEEKFLPGVMKQRKEQEDLHSVGIGNSHNDNSVDFLKVPKNKSPKIENRKRCNSSPDTSVDYSGKPVFSSKKHISTEKGRKRAHSLTERNSDREDDKKTHSGEKLFEWLIAPITSDQFFSFLVGLFPLVALFIHSELVRADARLG